MKSRRQAAFTLIELLMAAGVSTILGGIIYAIASEGLYSFARNASINRAYTDARRTVDRITADVQSAGYYPTLLDATGSPITVNTGKPMTDAAAGVRFYRAGSLPTYEIPSGSTNDSTLTVYCSSYQTGGGTTGAILKGDLVTIPLLGFQGTVASVANATAPSGMVGEKLTFTSAVTTIGSVCAPVRTSANPVSFTYTPAVAAVGSTPAVPAVYYTALVFRQVAYIAVPNTDSKGNVLPGAQLRYYPQAMSSVAGGTACGGVSDFNGAAFNTATNYRIMANLYGGVVTQASPNPAVNPLMPFQLLMSLTTLTTTVVTGSNTTTTTQPSITDETLYLTICEEGPDYNNRNLGMANTFSVVRSSAASRCPRLLNIIVAANGTTVPF